MRGIKGLATNVESHYTFIYFQEKTTQKFYFQIGLGLSLIN